jgi:hypothetical protein
MGKVAWIGVERDKVRKGQLLVRLDDRNTSRGVPGRLAPGRRRRLAELEPETGRSERAPQRTSPLPG